MKQVARSETVDTPKWTFKMKVAAGKALSDHWPVSIILWCDKKSGSASKEQNKNKA